MLACDEIKNLVQIRRLHLNHCFSDALSDRGSRLQVGRSGETDLEMMQQSVDSSHFPVTTYLSMLDLMYCMSY